MTGRSALDGGRVALRSGAVDAAVPLLERALEGAVSARDRTLEAEALLELARAFRARGANDRAFVHAEQAAAAAREASLPELLADARLLEAEILHGFGETRGAGLKAAEACSVLEEAARAARAAGDSERACERFERALAARALLGDAPTAAPRRDEGARRRERSLVVALLETSRRLVEERDPAKVVARVLEGAIEASGAERGFVLLPGGAEHRGAPSGRPGSDLPGGLEVAAARNFDRAEVRKPEFKVSRGVIEKALATRAPVLVRDAVNDPDHAGRPSVAGHRLRSLVCVPFEVRSVSGPGALYLDNRFAEGAFTEADLPALAAFAAHAAVAVESARLHADAAAKARELEVARARAEDLAKKLEAELGRTGDELARVKIERTQGQARAGLGEIVGSSHAMQEVYRLVEKVKDADVPVLIRGESGTGKELVARAIHFEGTRRSAPFVSESCAALPESLIESTLFGHEAGSFTGALGRRAGLFELAGEGTLFLDEVGELPLASQAKLLRVLQERVVRRIGSDREVPVHARVIAATNRDVEAMVRAGTFREDLYYRLNVVSVRLPALRERRDDVPLIVKKLSTLRFEPGALRRLVGHSWPGNVRELANELRRLEALGVTEVGEGDLVLGGETAIARAAPDGAPRTLREVERAALVAALRAALGNKARAAEILGIARGSLWHRVRDHRIRDAEWRPDTGPLSSSASDRPPP